MNAFKLLLLFYLTFTLNEFSEKNSCFPFNLGANCSLPLNVKGLSTPGKFNHQNKLRLLARCHSGCLFEVSTAFVGGTFLIFGWGFVGIGYIDVGQVSYSEFQVVKSFCHKSHWFNLQFLSYSLIILCSFGALKCLLQHSF